MVDTGPPRTELIPKPKQSISLRTSMQRGKKDTSKVEAIAVKMEVGSVRQADIDKWIAEMSSDEDSDWTELTEGLKETKVRPCYYL